MKRYQLELLKNEMNEIERQVFDRIYSHRHVMRRQLVNELGQPATTIDSAIKNLVLKDVIKKSPGPAEEFDKIFVTQKGFELASTR
ncbi:MULTISPECIES: hypothetical protein [Xanthomonas]|uniref:MarR family transcriptional regulator n=2 Tax=Xanthomonas TaxID=338 RepID=A0A7Z7NJ35_XANCH|nr:MULTISPECIES: hypothetical protein [Xanthomonas]ATS38505.1 hypothetical protein XcfCFBP6988P_10500 [Xanthomonas citri pv. phaseoli var. fuscans]ATS42694.1 hypothetical protein XcfCFBP6989P_09985 [Xanthomonas citri pv. phaseoli var. fuscans]ATS46505.1 hypothetical protein XcfCFBP6990P_07370 [Xanthomonas citri pv. phaseoli var. fuscans]ATS83236.1 hypothetical protein XcfCFBP6991P_04095 [Xanthomonas citri pv. phaseoli var. fuscans]QWN17380.1 hypothetical protein DGN02_17490 [Xanthomonas citri]